MTQRTFTVDQAALRSGVQLCAGFCERNTSIPILSNLHLRVVKSGDGPSKGRLIITATNLETTYRAPVEISGVTAETVFTLGAVKFASYVGLLPSEEITVEVDPNYWTRVRHKRGNCRIPGISPDSFPEIADGPLGNPTEIPLASLASVLRKALIAIPRVATKGTVRGALLELNENGAVVVSTDGHRLIWLFSPIKLGVKRTIVGPDGIQAILKLADSTKAETAVFSTSDRLCCVQAGGHTILTLQPVGDLPQYAAVLAQSPTHTVVAPSPELLVKLSMAHIADSTFNTVALGFSADRLTISAESSSVDGGAGKPSMMFDDSIPVNYSGPDVSICFEARYLEEFLRVSQEAGTVEIRFTDPYKMAEFRIPGNDNLRYLVMPKRKAVAR